MVSTLRSRLPSLALGSLLALVASPTASAEEQAGLSLQEVIALAKKNPVADAAHHDTLAARARITEAKGARYPVFEVTAFLAPSPDISCLDVFCAETDPDDVIIALDGVYGGTRVDLTQPIYTFGKIGNALDAARRGADAKGHAEGVVAGTLTERAAQAYYGIKLARDLVWMLEDGRVEIVKGQKRLEERLAAGDGDVTLQDRFRIEALLSEVDARLTEAREAEAVALAGLRALVGDPDADIDEEPLEAIETELRPLAEYQNEARVGRPDLKAVRAGAEALSALADFEQARYFPDLVLVGRLGFARAQGVDNPPSAFADDPFNSDTVALALAVQWKLDIASQRGKVKRARQEARRAEDLEIAAGVAASFDVARAYQGARFAHERLEVARTGERSARGWVASVLQADAIGTASAKELADAYIAYFTVRGRVLESMHDWNVALWRLRIAVGEFAATADRP